MARTKTPDLTPMPFPGESPTVSLAMAAGQKYGFHEDEKPAKAKPSRKAGKKSAKPKKAAAKPASKAKAARAKKSR